MIVGWRRFAKFATVIVAHSRFALGSSDTVIVEVDWYTSLLGTLVA